MARNPSLLRRLGLTGICGICLLPLLGPQPLRGQPAPETGAEGAPATALAAPGGPSPATTRVARVVAVRSSRRDHPNRASLGDGLTVAVENLDVAVAKSPKGCEGLILFLNEIPIDGVPPESCDVHTGNVRYTLDRTEESDRSWHALLEDPIAFRKIISVSLGPENNLSFPSKVDKFELEVLPPVALYSYFAGLLIFLLLLWRLATRTALIRGGGQETPEGKLAPYSLSRFQLAFWSFLVVAAYLFIWMITKELDTITGSVLALLGIGSATALGAKLIETGNASGGAAETGAGAPAREPAPAPAAPAKPAVSRGFLQDVLSDANGISLYRFQLFAWTLVLGVIFVASVYNGLQMPQFNPTLLGLMGISSGTYLGFKVPENRPPAAGGSQ